MASPRAPVLIVGLRNPGPEYRGTRHNVGEEIVGALGEIWGEGFKRAPGRIRAEVAETIRRGNKVVLALPRTFMNQSGPPVADLMRYFGSNAEDVVLVHDDIDLPFGKLRFHRGRGTGGHRGVDSVVGLLDTLEFCRLKAGVGRPPSGVDPADFVLRRFSARERPEVDRMVTEGTEVLEAFVDSGLQAAVQRAGESGRADSA